MLDINLLREAPEIVRKDLEKRKSDKLPLVDEVIQLDQEWKETKHQLDELRSQRNQLTKKIAETKKAGGDIKALLEESKALPQKIKDIEDIVEKAEAKIRSILMQLPNILDPSVPEGESDEENLEVRKWGEAEHKPELTNHADLAEQLDIADFDRAVKISGSGFFFLKNELALLNQALIRYAVDVMMKKGYSFYEVPFMIRREAYEGVTDLGDFETVMYKIENDDEYMIATSEHPLTAQFMNEVIPEKELPLKIVGVSQCFRREIGSAGIDTKGLYRVHQFTKVEQIVLSRPEDSEKFHQEMVQNAEDLFRDLGIAGRVVDICTGDMGTVAAKKFDVEAWSPRQGKYFEVVSGSNCTDYQSRRLNIRYGEPGKPKQPLVHTLNCTAIATSRALRAILEQYQQADGSVKIPDLLLPYMNGITIIKND